MQKSFADKCSNPQLNAESIYGAVVVFSFQAVVPDDGFERHMFVKEIIHADAEAETESRLPVKTATGFDILPRNGALTEKPGSAFSVEIITRQRRQADQASTPITAVKRQIHFTPQSKPVCDKKPGFGGKGENCNTNVILTGGGKPRSSTQQDGALVGLGPGLKPGKQKTGEQK